MDCRALLPFDDIHIQRIRLLVAQWWGCMSGLVRRDVACDGV